MAKLGKSAERIRDEDYQTMGVLTDRMDEVVEKKNRAEIEVAMATLDFNQFNKRMIKKYKLGEKDGVSADGTIVRNVTLDAK